MTSFKVAAAALAVAASFLLGSCATRFPEAPGWYGNHGGLYSMAFRAAVLERLASDLRQDGLYGLVGDNAFSLQAQTLCSPEELDSFLTASGRPCNILQGVQDLGDCRNANGCVKMKYDTGFNRVAGFRESLQEAISRPCDQFTDPTKLKYRSHPSTGGLSPDENWKLLKCDAAGVYGRNMELDESTGVVTFEFYRGGQ